MIQILTIYVRRVRIPLHAWVTNAEPVGVAQRNRRINVFYRLAGLEVERSVEPARSSKDVRV